MKPARTTAVPLGVAVLLCAALLRAGPVVANPASAARAVPRASVTLHWTAPGDDGTTGRAAAYDLRYSSRHITPATFAQATPVTGLPAPSAAGTRESMTITDLPPGTLYFAIVAGDAAGNWSRVSNIATPPGQSLMLDVPVVRQEPEHCGQAALEMVLRYWGAGDAAVAECARAYDPALRGSLVTDLAAAARRAGFDARIASLDADSLIALVRAGVPPIVLYQNGRWFTVRHFAVVTGWDPARGAFVLNDGTATPRTMAGGDLTRRWRTAGSQALLVQQREP